MLALSVCPPGSVMIPSQLCSLCIAVRKTILREKKKHTVSTQFPVFRQYYQLPVYVGAVKSNKNVGIETCRYDLFWGQEESIVAGVSQLHACTHSQYRKHGTVQYTFEIFSK